MAIELVRSIAGLRARLAEPRHNGVTIGLVPTMGALHAGHGQLIDRAGRECGIVVVSIFVNPLQFDRPDDLERYPRALEADLAFCERLGAGLVFAPDVGEMYPSDPLCTVDVGPLGDHLCGRHRPGHFRGVATVVLKLLQIAQPDFAYFGEKDAQQLAIVRRLVHDFNVPTQIVGVPTVREADGLALSSRNRRLNPDERRLASALSKALEAAAKAVAAGNRDVADVIAKAKTQVPTGDSLRLEYLEVVDPLDMQPVERITGPVLIAGAMWVGGTRLIDNVVVTPESVWAG